MAPPPPPLHARITVINTACGWPSPQDYNEAVQNPHTAFLDEDLKNGEAALNSLGLPKPDSGAFASVYRFHCSNVDYAVKCFLTEVSDQRTRYEQISNYVLTDDLDYTVGFEFIPEGLRVKGKCYPLLKMEWVDGLNFCEYVRRIMTDVNALAALGDRFRRMMTLLNEAGIAHGDLQHGNVLVTTSGELRLVDYDCMYVPGLIGWPSNELGHPNYQHPKRTAQHFGPDLDNLSAWSIDTSLRCLSLDPRLWDRLAAGDDCLLFRQMDFTSPGESRAFRILDEHENEEVRLRARYIRKLLDLPAESVPRLSFDLPE